MIVYFYLCINATAFGCGVTVYEPVPISQCYEMVKAARVENSQINGKEQRTVVAACVPKKGGTQ